MKLTVYTYTNIGGQLVNEDCLDYYEDDDKSIFVLADGLGSHGDGELASGFLVRSILEDLKKLPEIGVAELKDVFYRTNKKLNLKRRELETQGMLTTAVVLAVCKDRAVWGHLGDSRLYYLTGNEIAMITRDHSVTYKKYLAGEINYRDINTDEDRSSLLGAFGNIERYQPEFLETPQILKEGDAFLLCSDGFWESVYNEEILIDYLKASSPKEWADYMLLRHIKRTKPSNDNYTLIAVFIK